MEVDQDPYKLKGSSLGAPTMHDVIQAYFTLNQAFLLVQKLKSVPRALH
jgi:hypothetical protein